MVGTFSLLVCLLLATGRHCHATLTKSTSSIAKPISVGANLVISIDVTTSIQATDVQISLGGTRFKTVNIRPSSVTVTNDGAASYDSRVGVTYEVLTANTNVRVKVTFTSIPKADDGLVIEFKDTADVDAKSFILDVEYCNSAFFQPTASSLAASNTCGNGCTERFTCNSTFIAKNFTAQCEDTASWNVASAPCIEACDNSFFTNAVAADDSIVVNGGSKRFNCNCTQPVASFNRICGSDGEWSDQTNPCSSVCSATGISCGSPVSNGTLCGSERHQFNCNRDVGCDPRTFELECQANGTWVDTTCNCGTVCSVDSIKCGSPEGDGLLCGGKKHRFNCNGDLVCEPTTFELECHASGKWVNTTCNCQKDCNSLFFEPNATIINSSDTCGNGREQTFQCNRPFEPSSFTARCSDNSMWNLTETPCKISEKPLCIVPVVCKGADGRMNKRGWKDIDEIKQKALTHRLRLQFGDILKEISDDYRYAMSKFEKVKKEFELIPKKP